MDITKLMSSPSVSKREMKMAVNGEPSPNFFRLMTRSQVKRLAKTLERIVATRTLLWVVFDLASTFLNVFYPNIGFYSDEVKTHPLANK